jgi:hypothetical protein
MSHPSNSLRLKGLGKMIAQQRNEDRPQQRLSSVTAKHLQQKRGKDGLTMHYSNHAGWWF